MADDPFFNSKPYNNTRCIHQTWNNNPAYTRETRISNLNFVKFPSSQNVPNTFWVKNVSLHELDLGIYFGKVPIIQRNIFEKFAQHLCQVFFFVNKPTAQKKKLNILCSCSWISIRYLQTASMLPIRCKPATIGWIGERKQRPSAPSSISLILIHIISSALLQIPVESTRLGYDFRIKLHLKKQDPKLQILRSAHLEMCCMAAPWDLWSCR